MRFLDDTTVHTSLPALLSELELLLIPPRLPDDRTVVVDLHGARKTHVRDRVLEGISATLIQGKDIFLIIHGISGGVVKGEVHRVLGEIQQSKLLAWRVDPRNAGQTLVLIG